MGRLSGLAFPGVLAIASFANISFGSDLVFIEGGDFVMGDKFGDGDKDELPPHKVTVRSFLMSKFEVTQREYLDFCQETKSCYPEWMEEGSKYNIRTGSDNYYSLALVGEEKHRHPIVGVSWYDAIMFSNWKSKKEGFLPCYIIGKAGTRPPATADCGCAPPDTLDVAWNREANGYRLPLEAEWEYVATARGKRNQFSWGNGAPTENLADESFHAKLPGYPVIENYQDHYPCSSPVGSFAPNEAGIYDMGGNVFEWCWDRYYGPYDQPQDAPSAYRVIRGGAWSTTLHAARTSERSNIAPTCRGCNGGFRVVRNRVTAEPTRADPAAANVTRLQQ